MDRWDNSDLEPAGKRFLEADRVHGISFLQNELCLTMVVRCMLG